MSFLVVWCQRIALLVLFVSLTACFPGPKKQEPLEPAVVMLLPVTGPFGGIAGKIMQGARIARDELAANGVSVTLAQIDTNAKDWLKRYHDMPERFTVVGGPLERKAYTALKKNNLLRQRAVFAFSSTLDEKDEGVYAWRFFPSQLDQAESLVNFATNKLKIRSFGLFSGSDPFSVKMAAVFEKVVRANNGSLQKASYSATDKSHLLAQSKTLFMPTKENGRVVPNTPFEAVFIPSSWRTLDSILTAFAGHGEDRVVILGEMGWEQSLRNRHLPNPKRYELVCYPVGFNDRAQIPAMTKAKVRPDFWVALGYDFVRFAVAMRLPKDATPLDVVNRANHANTNVRLLAPIYWDSAGIAHQNLFIERVGGSGCVPMDVKEFMHARSKRKEEAALRMQGGGTPIEGEVVEGSKPVKPVVTESAPMPKPEQPLLVPGTMPPSSHKLRLPVKQAL
ncbi:MAG: ABC transporter substrate-binding protein [Desulfovibrio sp.]|nr:ABC transporter substrate-binding protein [Desulfovibrio sp.]